MRGQEAVFTDNCTEISDDVLAVSLEKAEPSGYVKEWKINGEAVTIGVAKRDEA